MLICVLDRCLYIYGTLRINSPAVSLNVIQPNMLKRLFSSNKKLTRCIVFYSFGYDRSLTKELFHFLLSYFKTNADINFNYLGFYNERYADKYGAFETSYKKIQQAKWDEIVNFALDVDDLRARKRSISVEFNITRPVGITVVLPEETPFDIADFVRSVYGLFKITYGFSYFTKDNYWATAYAIGDREHSKLVKNNTRLSKDHFERWFKNCEKIADGYLRDIYEDNIVNTMHLARPVNGTTLKEYIDAEKAGSLQSINNETFFWKLNDIQLKDCRDFVYKAGILI